MSTLKGRLDRIQERFDKQASDEVKGVMHRATADLRASGILDRIPKPGDPLPPFELPDTQGQPVRSGDLHDDGPLVLTFYRGLW